jgi:hypothetical protein
MIKMACIIVFVGQNAMVMKQRGLRAQMHNEFRFPTSTGVGIFFCVANSIQVYRVNT